MRGKKKFVRLQTFFYSKKVNFQWLKMPSFPDLWENAHCSEVCLKSSLLDAKTPNLKYFCGSIEQRYCGRHF